MERTVEDIPEMYAEMMYLMSMQGKEEQSRNGRVSALAEPLLVRVKHPTSRVLYDPYRNANPFFHVMEFVWMMSGSQDPTWITQFNSRFSEYADTNNALERPLIHGAYGHRWRRHFGKDQILNAIRMLQQDPTSRRVVLEMWDAAADLGTVHNDLPCNTHIYLRITNDELEMTVCNRSNDVIWGMTGANAVHMTMLQELIAQAVGVGIGEYCVFTVNAHVYPDLVPNFKKLIKTMNSYYPEGYSHNDHLVPILAEGENHLDFLTLCEDFVNDKPVTGNQFLLGTCMPIQGIYILRKEGSITTKVAISYCDKIEDKRWRMACIAWLQRKL